MRAGAKWRGSLGSFRQKGVAVEGKNCVSEVREGFGRVDGGFVLFLRDVAMARRVLKVLRNRKREDLRT